MPPHTLARGCPRPTPPLHCRCTHDRSTTMSPSLRFRKSTGTLPQPDDPVNAGHDTGAPKSRRQRHARPGLHPVLARSGSRTLTALLGWTAVAGTALFGLFAWYSAIVELLSLTGVVHQAPGRAAPPLFVLHALAGGVALTAAALQLRLAPRLLNSRPALHRAIGRTYIW